MEPSAETAVGRSQEIKQKMHFTGTVVKTALSGAVVDLGGGVLAGLHISQMTAPNSEEPIKRVEDVLQVGQQVEVWVRKVKDNRIELTQTKPLDLEWREIKKGMTVKGKVTRLEKFGAFVEIGAERPGLIHISEMAHGYVRQPSDIVKEGDEVEAQVLDVNRRKKQIKLSLKALQEEPVKEVEPARLIEAAPKGRPGRRKKGARHEGKAEGEGFELEVEGTQPAEPDPTAMEIALREAMDRAKARKTQNAEKGKRGAKGISKEQEDLLSRTLEQKSRNS